MQQVKPVWPTSHTRAPGTESYLSFQSSLLLKYKAADGGSSTCDPATHVGDLHGFHVVGIWRAKQ